MDRGRGTDTDSILVDIGTQIETHTTDRLQMENTWRKAENSNYAHSWLNYPKGKYFDSFL